jgi:hypothetical protein
LLFQLAYSACFLACLFRCFLEIVGLVDLFWQIGQLSHRGEWFIGYWLDFLWGTMGDQCTWPDWRWVRNPVPTLIATLGFEFGTPVSWRPRLPVLAATLVVSLVDVEADPTRLIPILEGI